MDEALSRYLRSLSDPEIPVSISDVEKLMNDYPYFTLPAVTLLRREGAALPTEVRRRLLAQAALNAPDRTTLAILSDPDSDTWLNFYPPEKKSKVTTENVIDTFLATYGHSSLGEDALLERLIFNPTAPDYTALLPQEEEKEENRPLSTQDALIDAFILKNTPAAPPKPSTQTLNHKPAPLNQEDTSLTESLAKIYIRRHRYDKAFEIIHNLSLKNPKKSVYFADQLRFLRKLMLNSSYENQNRRPDSELKEQK